MTRAEVLAEIPRTLMDSALVSNGRFLYLMGGYDVYDSGFSDLVYRYDIRNQTWSEMTPMPKKLGYISAGVINGRIYIPGGITGYGRTDPRPISMISGQTNGLHSDPTVPLQRYPIIKPQFLEIGCIFSEERSGGILLISSITSIRQQQPGIRPLQCRSREPGLRYPQEITRYW